MTVLLADLVLGAQELADLVTPGDTGDFITPDRWAAWTNQSIASLFRKLVIAQPDLFLTTADFTVAENGSITLPIDFVAIRGLTKNPGQPNAREVHRFNFGSRESQGTVTYRRMGSTILLEPGRRAAGDYRLHYIARPEVLAYAPAPDVIVRAATAADLAVANPDAVWQPSQTDVNLISLSGGGGAGGSLLVDGVAIGAGGLSGDKILIRHGAVSVTPSYFVSLIATDPLPLGGGSFTADLGVPGGTVIQRSSGDPGFTALVIDGVTVPEAADPGADNKVLVAGQADPIQNGLYFCQNNNPGGWSLRRIDGMDLGAANSGTAAYNGVFATVAARVAVSGGDDNSLTTWSLTSGVAVDTADLTWELGVEPGKGLWLCGGALENGNLFFSRMPEALSGAHVPKGLLVQATEGTVNADLIFSSFGDADTIGGWIVETSDVDFNEVTTTDVLPVVFSDFVEWIEVRTAIRALGKEESSETLTMLTARLTELTQELLSFSTMQDSADGDAAIDLERDAIRHRLFPWSGE